MGRKANLHGLFWFCGCSLGSCCCPAASEEGAFPTKAGLCLLGSALKWEKENTSFCGDAVAEKKKILGLCFFSSFRFALVLPGVKYNCQQFTGTGNVSFPVEENIKERGN